MSGRLTDVVLPLLGTNTQFSLAISPVDASGQPVVAAPLALTSVGFQPTDVYTDTEIHFPAPATVEAGKQYAIVLTAPNENVNNDVFIAWADDAGSSQRDSNGTPCRDGAYSPGRAWGHDTEVPTADADFFFFTFVVPTSGTAGPSPVSGTLAYQLCRGEFCPRSWLATWDIGQAGARPLTPRLGPRQERFDGAPAWSPDGKSLAFVRVTTQNSGIYIVDADGKGLRRIIALNPGDAGAADFTTLRWSPDGTRLVFDRYGGVECSGFKAFRHRLTIATIDGSGVVDVPVLPRAITYRQLWHVMGWSPDGTKLLYSVTKLEYDEQNPGGCREHGPEPGQLYTIGADGRGRQLLASGDAEIEDAAWSPDSKRVAYGNCYYTFANGGDVWCDLAVVGADGPGRRTIFFSNEASTYRGGGIVWSVKGDEVIANLGRALFAINASSGRRRRLGASGEILGLSRDGQYVAVWGPLLLLVPLSGGAPLDVGREPIPKGVQLGSDADLFLR